MPNTELTLERVEEEVRMALGSSALEVELSQNDIRLSLRRALREYNRYLPRWGRLALPVTSSQKRYRIDDLIPNLIGVVDVQFITRRVEPADVDPFDPYVTSLAGPNYGDETFGDVAQRLAYAEDAQRIISSEPEWHGQWEVVDDGTNPAENQYALYVSFERVGSDAALTFTQRYTMEEDAYGLLGIPQGDVDLLVEFTTAFSMRTLARIRGKFYGITNPEGSTDTVDYVELDQRGEQEIERIREAFRARKPPYVPVIE